MMATLMRLAIVGAAAAATTGCLTTPGGGASVREIITDPPGAMVTLESGGSCETPCTIKLDRPQKARIAKAGYVTVTAVIAPGGGKVKIPLELAAASTGVDATALPELD